MKKNKFTNSMNECLLNFWKNYAGLGRATRSEYWWCVLFYVVIIGSFLSFSTNLLWSWFLITIVPFTCLTIRRLHDINYSAWNILWFPEGILLITEILLLFLFLLELLFHVPTTDIVVILFKLATPIFWISAIYSLLVVCTPGDTKPNKYGSPRI